MPLTGKTALVTGAARGIGRAIALELARRGASVGVNYRSSRLDAEAVAECIRDIGVPAIAIQGDVRQPAEARAVVQKVMDTWKRLDVLVNNSGITRDRSLRKMSDDEWADVIHIDPNGTYYCINAAIPNMMEQKFGRIINIAACVGEAGNGIVAFTKTLALEIARYNITANAVAPGFVESGILSRVPPEIQQQIKSRIPMGRFGEPEEVARTVAFLAADAGYITGQHINVSGGMCI